MPILVWLVIAVLLGLYISGPVMDPDLWWHIVVGRWILAHREFPVVDHWNMFGIGKPWIAYSWSNEIIFAFVEKRWGIEGLLLIQAGLGICIAAILMWTFGKLAKDNFLGALFGSFATAASYNHFTLRPQSITWILLGLLIVVADKISREKVTTKSLLLVTLLSTLWANTHITAFLGVGVASAWAMGEGSRKEQLTRGVSVFGAGIIGLFLTPYMGAEVITLFSKAGHPFTYDTIAEFQAAQITHYSTAFVLIGLAILLLFIHAQPKILPPIRVLLIAVSVIMALAVVKFIPIAIILIMSGVSVSIHTAGLNKLKLGRLSDGLNKLGDLYREKLEGQGLLMLLLACISLQGIRLARNPLSLVQVPKDAVDYIINNKLPGPILNIFGDGGYLMYRLADSAGEIKTPVAVDGRTNVNPPEIMRKHAKAVRGQLGWEDYLAAVKPNTILWRTEGPLVSILLERPEWKLVHQDGSDEKGHVVFTRVQ